MQLKPALPWLALALGLWAAGLAAGRLRAHPERTARPEWQHSWLELDGEGRRTYALLREDLFEAENQRARTGSWPAPAWLAGAGLEPFAGSTWVLRRQGLSVNYLGESAGVRWLVVILEADPAERRLASPTAATAPFDEEHHTLGDGTALHLTVWTQPLSARAPENTLSFPATEGWVQRVGQ